MRFKTRLVVGHATLVVVTLAIGVTALVAMRTSTTPLETVARHLTTDVIAVHRLHFEAEQMVATSRGYLLSGDPDKQRRFEAEAARVEAMLGEVGPRAEHVERAVRDYIRAAHQAAQQRTATDDPQTIVPFFERTLMPARASLQRAISELVAREQEAFELASARARRSAESVQTLVAIASALAIGLGVALAWLSSRKLSAQYAREQEATELARRAVGVRDELLAVVSHDLRTPLQTIAMSAYRLESVEASPDARRPLAAIATAAARMQHLIGQLLDAARLESGRLVLQREPCAAGELLEAAAALFRERAAEGGVELACRAAPGSVAHADRERVLQVLSNLLGNAFRFTPAGGRIEVAAEDADGAMKLSVTDSGPGISQDDLPRLFERHWQGGSKQRGSLGLGLYICKKIVEAHGGCIGVDTELGRGSTFWFTLPRT